MNRIRDNENKMLYEINSDTLKKEDIEDIAMINTDCEKVSINLQGVNSIDNSTLDLLKEVSKQNKLSLCNLEADVFAVLNLMHYDKYFNLYSDEENMKTESNELINRRFKVV